MNNYTVTISDGTNTDVLPTTAQSHVQAAQLALEHSQNLWAALSDAVTLTITVTRP